MHDITSSIILIFNVIIFSFFRDKFIQGKDANRK